MKLSSKLFLWFFLSAVLLSACSKDTEETVHEIIIEPKTELNVSYGNDERQKMDIYLPGNRSQSTTRVILLIHGGGWYEGEKKDMNDFALKFQNEMKNYAVINMNYRLVTFLNPVRYMLPTQTDDIRAAMDYVSKNASKLGLKPEFVVVGLSAGGHLAMLYSYKYNTERRVKAVVNIVGPSNLNDSNYLNNILFSLAMGYIIDPKNLPSDKTAPEFGSPITWVTNTAPPTIAFYGTKDDLIPYTQHSYLENALKQNGIPHEKHIYEGDHIEASYQQTADIVDKSKTFISTHVK